MNIERPYQMRRENRFYGKANWEQMKSKLNSYCISNFDKLPASGSLWEKIKSFLNSLSDKFIPSKITKQTCDLWPAMANKKLSKKIH